MMVIEETAAAQATWIAQATADETEWKETTTKETTTGAQVISEVEISIDRFGPPIVALYLAI